MSEGIIAFSPLGTLSHITLSFILHLVNEIHKNVTKKFHFLVFYAFNGHIFKYIDETNSKYVTCDNIRNQISFWSHLYSGGVP